MALRALFLVAAGHLLLGETFAQRTDSIHAFPKRLTQKQAWDRLPLKGNDKGKPLPQWALVVADSLPSTTAYMIILDRVHRTGDHLEPLTRASIRWIAASSNRCDYSRAQAAYDLRQIENGNDRLEQLTADNNSFDSADQAVFDFARKMTIAADTVSDDEVQFLIEQYGEKKVVAIVLLLAYSNFQDRLLISLGIDSEPDGALPSLELDIDDSIRPQVPARVLPQGSLPAVPRELEESAWAELDFDDLTGKMEEQKQRDYRIRLPEAKGAASTRVQWTRLCMGYQPTLTRAWFRCMGMFHREARQDRVFEESLFWVITRTIHCFY